MTPPKSFQNLEVNSSFLESVSSSGVNIISLFLNKFIFAAAGPCCSEPAIG